MNDSPQFNRRTICESLILLAIGVALQLMFCGCSTHKTIETVSSDSVKSIHFEKANVWANMCQIDTFLKERLLTIVVNEKGDTIKEKEYIYIQDKSSVKADTGVSRETADTTAYKVKYIEHKSQTSMNAWDAIRVKTWLYVMIVALFGMLFFVISIYNKVIKSNKS